MRKIILTLFAVSMLTACGKNEREPTFVGNKETKIVHRISCSIIERMSEDNRVMFKTFKKAKGEGYKACDKCNPDER